jgi:sarcosine oxidase, subunit gamma
MADGTGPQSILTEFAGRLSEVGAASSGRITIRELPFAAQLNLRADPGDNRVAEAVRKALGFGLPKEPNTAFSAGGRSALWLGPDEWLVVGGEGEEALLQRVLRTALGDAFGSVVDVSANRTVIELSGPSARDVLAHGCPLDLHPRQFTPGRCAQTLLAKAQVIIHQVNELPTFHLYVRTSFAWYVADWLLDALVEYRVAEPVVPNLPSVFDEPPPQGEGQGGGATEPTRT